MSHLSANLAAIAAVSGWTPRLPEDDGRVRVTATDSVPVLHLTASTGQPVALNSRRDPLGEALRALDSALADRPAPRLVVAVGLGLGFVIDAIEHRCPGAKILALEPEAACVRPLLERRDFTNLFASNRLLLLWGPEYHGAAEAWRFLDGTDGAPVTITHPVLLRSSPDAVKAAANVVERVVFGARSNAEAKRRFAPRYLNNTLRNLPFIAGSADVAALFDAFTGVPGVVVSAGPSLDRNIIELRRLAHRVVLVAVDTALRPLLSAGIHPHLVVALDPSEANARHLRHLPETHPTHLVAEGSISPTAFEAFGGRLFTFKVGDHHPWPWLRTHGLDRTTLRAWGSVATSAFDLTLRLGCDPIIFAGQDLAYTGGRPYCRGTVFEEDWAARVGVGMGLSEIWRAIEEEKATLRATDVNGCAVGTTRELVAFRDWLAEQCWRSAEHRFINATGGGILSGPGIEVLDLRDVAAMIGPARVDVNEEVSRRAARA